MKALRLLPLLVFLAACDTAHEGPLDGLTLSADREAYAVGGEVGLTLRNGGPVEAGTTGLYCALLEQRTGERLGPLNVPSIQTPYVVGDNVFVVDTEGQLLAITRREGQIVWTAQLPGAKTWSGPVLAGNRLWLASNRGHLIGYPIGRLGWHVVSAETYSDGRLLI